MRLRPAVLIPLVTLVAACAGDSSAPIGDGATTTAAATQPPPAERSASGNDARGAPGTDPVATSDPSDAAPAAAPTTAATSTTTAATSTTTTSTTTTSTTTTSTIPPPPGPTEFDLAASRTLLGHSVEGRPIEATRVGEPGGRRVLVIGVIHGDEDDGVPIVDDLEAGEPIPGVELWLVDSMNPDGQQAQIRHNANGVDLNRNFPYNWSPIAEPGDWQYAGSGPASEPETQSMVAFIEALRPDIVVWYHQDLFMIAPSSGRDGRIRARYAELTGLPLERITGGTYTGVAATWARNLLGPTGGVAFIVELGPTVTAEEVAIHAEAVRTIASEG